MQDWRDRQALLEQYESLTGETNPEEERDIERAAIQEQLNEGTINPLIDQQELRADIKESASLEEEIGNDLNKETDKLQEELQEESPTVNPIADYSNVLKDYDIYSKLAKAQEERRNILGSAAIMMGGNKIAQGFARGSGAEIGAGDELAKEMIRNSDLPVKEIEELVKGKDVQLSMDLSDPQSDISKFAREQAAIRMSKLNPNFNPELFQNMSAAQLEKLGFKSVGNSSRLRFERVKENGVVKLVAIDDVTGDRVRDYGEAGFASQFRKDDRTGEIIGVSPSNLSQTPVKITGPGKQRPKLASGGEEEPKFTIADLKNNLDNKTFDSFKKYQTSFFTESKEDRAAKRKVDGIMDLVRNAVNNPAARGQAGAAVARIFEKGVLTDQDVKRYVERAGIANQVTDILTKFGKGTFDKTLAKQINQSLESYNKTLADAIKGAARERAKVIRSEIPKDVEISEENIAELLYSSELPQSADRVKIQLPNGKVGSIPRSKLEKAKKREAKEI